MHTTQLSRGKITNADELTIELLEPPGRSSSHSHHLARQSIDHHTRPVRRRHSNHYEVAVGRGDRISGVTGVEALVALDRRKARARPRAFLH
jgi:hypothetical protein